MKEWDVWMEGYRVTGGESDATYCGKFAGETFIDACDKWAETLPDDEKHLYKKSKVNGIMPSFWGCGLFDNEADARRYFG